MDRVAQIMPADGWWAFFTNTDDPHERPAPLESERLVAWALCENEWEERLMRGVLRHGFGTRPMEFADELLDHIEPDDPAKWLEYVHADELEIERKRLQLRADKTQERLLEMLEERESVEAHDEDTALLESGEAEMRPTSEKEA